MICDLVPMEGLVGPLRTAELRASTRLQTADAIHLAAAVYWGWDALLTNDRDLNAALLAIRPQPVAAPAPASLFCLEHPHRHRALPVKGKHLVAEIGVVQAHATQGGVQGPLGCPGAWPAAG
ncbi:MAG: type II toxin-antitoxin system VapC family toxin [Cyanobium sp.]